MFKLKTMVTPIALCLSLALAGQAMAKPEHGHRKMMKAFSQLSITDAQKQDIKQIFKQSREDKRANGPDASPFKADLDALVHSSEWDQAAVEALLSQQQTQKSQSALKRAENKHAVMNVLTAEQRSQLTEMMAERKEKFAEKANRKGKGNGKRKGMGRLKRALSDEQIAAIDSIRAENKETSEALRDKLKAFKQAERALVTSPEFNSDSWAVLNEEYQDDFLAMQVLQAKTKHQIWNVLTPEQQAKMQKMQKRFKGKQHRKERSRES